MLSVADAQSIVLRHARPLPAESLPVAPALLGLVLAEDIASDIDMPPWDKSMMDGYALRSVDVPDGTAELTVIEEVTAGQTPKQTVGSGQATRIMTGAPIPAGADAVVQVERTQLNGNRVRISDRPKPGQNILQQGREMRRGERVLSPGNLIRPQTIGLLATVGRTSLKVHPSPAVAILATGDELVEAKETPGPGQIRNGNGPMIAAQASRAGAMPRYLGIARDNLEHLREKIGEGLQSPVLVLSGGVSAGKLDLVPGVLCELGVEAHFHKVEMKPGKPMFFGTLKNDAETRRHGDAEKTARSPGPRVSASPCLVFGLPGNPVSSLVCFELFVRPALRRLMGHADTGIALMCQPLAEDFAYKTDRPTYYPSRLEMTDSGPQIRPGPWFGSADLRAVAECNGFVLFPPGDNQFRAGERYPFIATDGVT